MKYFFFLTVPPNVSLFHTFIETTFSHILSVCGLLQSWRKQKNPMNMKHLECLCELERAQPYKLSQTTCSMKKDELCFYGKNYLFPPKIEFGRWSHFMCLFCYLNSLA